MEILQTVKQFLHKNLRPGASLLLGFSGGPDSLSLFHLLLECKKIISFQLHLAHVDHGWREESGSESAFLKQSAERLGIPFHLHKLESCDGELEAREERLKFFHKVHSEYGCQALLLAHQADDQAETVLKRIFEGKGLSSLGGLKEISSYQGMDIWRPLLSIPKAEIIKWLQGHNLVGLDDWTNRDPRFLRARMRTQILPELERMFGKHVSTNLISIGSAAQELKAYLTSKITPYLSVAKRGPFGIYIDLNGFYPIDNVELMALVKHVAEEEKISLSHAGLQMILQALSSGSANRRLDCNGRWVVVDRGRLFFLKGALPKFNFTVPLKTETIVQDNWIFELKCEPYSNTIPTRTSWEDLWLGKAVALLPEGDYHLTAADTGASFPGTSPIKKWWNEKKVPAFLRQSFPCISQGKKVVHEFLTGKTILKEKDLLIIFLEIKSR